QFQRPEACASHYRPVLQGNDLPLHSTLATRLAHDQWQTLEARHEPRQPPLNRGGRLRHSDGGEWPVELAELGFFGGLLRAALPERLPVRGWQLLSTGLPPQPLLPLRRGTDGLAFVFTHGDVQASNALAACI